MSIEPRQRAHSPQLAAGSASESKKGKEAPYGRRFPAAWGRDLPKVDLVVIGAGPAGLATAAETARLKGRVIVLDESPIPGGRLPGQVHPEPRSTGGVQRRWSNGRIKAEQLFDEAQKAGAKIVCGASAWGVFPEWFVGVTPATPLSPKKGLPVGFEARALLIATGATQNPMVLPGWTLPGVITAGAAQTMINVHRVLPGRKVMVIGLDPLSLSVAHIMAQIGVEVQGVFLPPANALQFGPSLPATAIKALSRFSNYAPNRWLSLLSQTSAKMSGVSANFFPTAGLTVDGIKLFLRQSVLAIEGQDRAEAVTVAKLRADGAIKSGNEEKWPVDTVITSAGLSPLVELLQVGGCPLVHVADLGGWVPVHNAALETPVAGLFVAGSVTGVEGAPVAEAQGRLSGLAAAGYLGLVEQTDVKQKVAKYRAAISAARKNALAFLPNIEKGREDLRRHSIHCAR